MLRKYIGVLMLCSVVFCHHYSLTYAAESLKVGVHNFQPLVFLDEQGEAKGLFVDVLNYIARQEQWAITYIPCSLHECLIRLEQGEIDLLLGVAYTPERTQRFDFTTMPMFVLWAEVHAHPAKGILSLLDLQGKTVGVLKGAQANDEFLKLAAQFGVTCRMVEYAEYAEVVRAVHEGEADAGIFTSLYALYNPEVQCLERTEMLFAPTKIHFAVKKGQQQTILATLNRYVTAFHGSQQAIYTQLFYKWFSYLPFNLPPWLVWSLFGMCGACGVLLVFSMILKRQVAQKTATLQLTHTALARELSDRKQAEEALYAAHQEVLAKNIELHEANASKDKFFAVIAHDLRSPFTGLLGYLGMLTEQFDDLSVKKLKDTLDKMHLSAKCLYALLENLLAWSRLQSGLVEYRPAALPLADVSAAVLGLFTANAEQKGLTLTCAIPAGIAVTADAAMLQTILRNLLSNALKFTPDSGRITLAAQPLADTVEITVTDTGCGISPEMLSDLFRTDRHTTTLGTKGEPGSGLGLLLCHDLVQKHGGNLQVDSTVGVGTTFRFTLPFAETAVILPPTVPHAAPSPPVADLIPPPPEVLRELLDLVNIGDVRGIDDLARELSERDARYALTAAHIFTLRKTYHLAQIRELVERWLQSPPADGEGCIRLSRQAKGAASTSICTKDC